MIEITKYGNRKLYSKTSSEYLTLSTLRDKIKAGNEVRVTDHETGRDITSKVLASVVTTMGLDTNKLAQIIKGA